MTAPLSRAGAGIVIVYLGTEDVWLFLRTILGSGRQESSLEAAISNFGAAHTYSGALDVGYEMWGFCEDGAFNG